MKIATNTPFSFPAQSGYEFIHLGEDIDDVAMIVLMLRKNWGGGSIDVINALTHWISAYPKDTPCYVIGCETTIPDKNLQNYRMPARDDAVRALCDEVLRRSRSIGVRGAITSLYLTDMLGYDSGQVDVVYESDAGDNAGKVLSFLKKNNIPLERFVDYFVTFQRQPGVYYERPTTFDKDITIPRPYVTASGSTVRLNADVLIDGQKKTLWCETDDVYRQFLLSERADAFVCALLPFAMRSGQDIVSEAPVTEQFLHNLNEILIPHLCNHDPRLHRTQIAAPSDASTLFCGNAVAAGMSCGVDSFYTVSLYKSSPFKSMNLTHLYTGNYLYGNDGAIYERSQLAAEELSLPLVRTATNINEALNLPHLYTHFFKTMFGVLALRKLFRIYYYSTAEDFSHFNLKSNATRDTAITELLLLYSFTCSDFQLVTGGAKSDRVEKTRAICAFPPARTFLNVCLDSRRKQNCGKCGKCMRTLLMLDMLDSLDLFRAVFDIDDYRANRIDSFVYLVQEKNSIMLSRVYQHFLRTEPALVKEAEARLSAAARAH